MITAVERSLRARTRSYETRRREHLLAMRQRIPAHLERIEWPQELLEQERETRLLELIRIARERSPWHRERLGPLNVDEFGEKELSSIPVMTKHDLMTNYDQIVTEPGITLDLIESHLATLTSDAYLKDRFHAAASGGTSGYRGVYIYDWESWADAFLTCMRYDIRAQVQHPRPPDHPVRVATVAAQHATHMSSSLPQTFSDPETSVNVCIPVTRPLPQIVAELNATNPDALIAYPSLLPSLAHEARAGRLKISPSVIMTVAEPLLPEIRATTEETWNAPVMNWWASSEGGGMGIGCGRGKHLHLTDDLLIIEPVNADGEPVPPGIRSEKTLLTNLYNPLLPLIRLEITDQITLVAESEPCPCGSTHRRIEDVYDRLDDLFFYPRLGSVHPHVFRSRLGRERGIVEYHVRQTEHGAAIAIRCRGDVETARLRGDIAGDLIQLGLRDPDITVVQVDSLERQSTGKLKRFLPLAEVK